MRRILIIGSGGAGKSTLARQLGAELGLPVYHLDQLYWKPGWVKSSREEFADKQATVLRMPEWIIDGNFGETIQARLDAADTVIFLDFPTRVCLWGVFRRYFRYRNRTRPDMTEGSPEKFPDWDFLWWILSYRTTRRPRVMRRLAGVQRAIVLQSRKEVDAFRRSLKPAAAGPRLPREG